MTAIAMKAAPASVASVPIHETPPDVPGSTRRPVRIDRGGEVLAPGNPKDPVQFIDGRDLAEWTIRMVENGGTGIYNATGPAKELGIGGMLDGIKSASCCCVFCRYSSRRYS